MYIYFVSAVESLSETVTSPVVETQIQGHRGSYPDISTYLGIQEVLNPRDGRASPSLYRQGNLFSTIYS